MRWDRLSNKSTPSDTIDIQINNADSYQAQPTTFDCQLNPATRQHFAHVPIIRVFGSTSSGQNVMVHVHGVYPYLYIPFKGELSDGKHYFVF